MTAGEGHFSRLTLEGPTRIGHIDLAACPRGLTKVVLGARARSEAVLTPTGGDPGGVAILHRSADQLREFFAGRRRRFEIPVDFFGLPPFVVQVLQTLQQVPFGATLTYGQLAERCGRPGAARAVGRAMAVNPVPIVVPCHRVVGSNGNLTGYSGYGGLATKRWLLALEGAVPAPQACRRPF